MESEFRQGTCSWCGDEGEVYCDTGRCEDCDSDVANCTICKQDYHRNDTCRHIFVDHNLDWQGAGLLNLSDDSIRVSLFQLFDLTPRGFAQDVRAAIAAGKFYTWFDAPLIGGWTIITLYGCRREWGDDIAALGEMENTGSAADGYRWLSSLFENKTPKANKLTITWIDAWLDLPALAVLADDGCPHVHA